MLLLCHDVLFTALCHPFFLSLLLFLLEGCYILLSCWRICLAMYLLHMAIVFLCVLIEKWLYGVDIPWVYDPWFHHHCKFCRFLFPHSFVCWTSISQSSACRVGSYKRTVLSLVKPVFFGWGSIWPHSFLAIQCDWLCLPWLFLGWGVWFFILLCVLFHISLYTQLLGLVLGAWLPGDWSGLGCLMVSHRFHFCSLLLSLTCCFVHFLAPHCGLLPTWILWGLFIVWVGMLLVWTIHYSSSLSILGFPRFLGALLVLLIHTWSPFLSSVRCSLAFFRGQLQLLQFLQPGLTLLALGFISFYCVDFSLLAIFLLCISH